MTHSHFYIWHHSKISKARWASNMARDSKSVNLTHFRRLSICNLFSRNTSHSHDNLRKVSKSPLLHPFTCRRSGTLDWRVTKATSADSSRLIHTILAHSSIALFYCTLLLHSSMLLHYIIFQTFVAIGQYLHFLICLVPKLCKNRLAHSTFTLSFMFLLSYSMPRFCSQSRFILFRILGSLLIVAALLLLFVCGLISLLLLQFHCLTLCAMYALFVIHLIYT
jgi:hypothetical protein